MDGKVKDGKVIDGMFIDLMVTYGIFINVMFIDGKVKDEKINVGSLKDKIKDNPDHRHYMYYFAVKRSFVKIILGLHKFNVLQ